MPAVDNEMRSYQPPAYVDFIYHLLIMCKYNVKIDLSFHKHY